MTAMPVIEVHPLEDPRWASFIDTHPKASVFHTTEWITALQQTYKYSPTVLTTSSSDLSLTNGIVCCRIDSWLTGSRYVSLPFSDHCEPLINSSEDLPQLLAALSVRTAGKITYTEIRPRSLELPYPPGWLIDGQYCFHALDLGSSLADLQAGLHKDSIRRKIRRAERERVIIEKGSSQLLLQQFYQLMLLTRRRHGIPPQPFSWFRNLVASFGPRLTIYLARTDNQPIASILTLRYKQTLVYKYGSSDARFHNLGGMPLLFWQAIRDAKEAGLKEFDLGRSDQSNHGLIRFKDHLGAQKTFLQYRRFSTKPTTTISKQHSPLMGTIVSHLPDRLFRLAGELFYRHAG